MANKKDVTTDTEFHGAEVPETPEASGAPKTEIKDSEEVKAPETPVIDPVFKSNPDLKEYFRTSDGEVFYKETFARYHATKNKLKDSSVKKVTR